MMVCILLHSGFPSAASSCGLWGALVDLVWRCCIISAWVTIVVQLPTLEVRVFAKPLASALKIGDPAGLQGSPYQTRH